jgi:hypothetical protein
MNGRHPNQRDEVGGFQTVILIRWIGIFGAICVETVINLLEEISKAHCP